MLNTDDFKGLHQLLLLCGQWPQHLLQLGKQRMLDGLPVGGERGAQEIHCLLLLTALESLR